jgi:hypothetical protein
MFDAVGGIVNYMSEKHKKAWIGDHEKKLRIPCSRLDYILKDVRQINMFILDVREYAMTLLPALRLLNIRLELQSMPLTQAVRISHFVCTYPCNINKSETALSFSEFVLSNSMTQ